MGQELEGPAGTEGFGFAVSLSADGRVLAVGAPIDDRGAPPQVGTDQQLDANIGSCYVFAYDEEQTVWEALGAESGIAGLNVGDHFGTSVSLNENGTAVAVGAIYTNAVGDDSGSVRVFHLDDEMASWQQMGDEMPGPYQDGNAGISVALSASGDTVVVGVPNSVNRNSDQKGTALVFETGILRQGGEVPVSVAVDTVSYFDSEFSSSPDCEAELTSWSLQRIDVEEYVHLYAEVPPETYTECDSVETTTITVHDNGVYLFTFEGHETSSFRLFFGDSDEDPSSIISIERNVTEPVLLLFSAPALATSGSPTVGSETLRLSLAFDQFPSDVSWAVIATFPSFDEATGRSRMQRRVLAFGPETPYSADLANSAVDHEIDVSQVPRSSTFFFYYHDAGRDGLCCDSGSGSVSLYDSSEELIFVDNLENARLRTIRFSLVV